MKQQKYVEIKNEKNINKTREFLEKLPLYVEDYVISIESSTTTLTRLNYVIDLTNFFEYLSVNMFCKPIKQITLSDINGLKSMDIERYLSYLSTYNLKGKHLTNADISKARKLSSIRSFLMFLFSKDLISSNVASKVRSPKIRSKEIIRLEVDEVTKLLNQVETPCNLTKTQQAFNKHTQIRDSAITTLLLGTGIRVSECVGIDINDLDFDNNAFKITRKGGSEVVLYFSDEVREVLVKWLEQRENILGPESTEQALFISLQNKRISIRAVEKLVKKYAQAVTPLKKISPHKLRSTYGTNLYRETKDIYIVADVLGHKDVNTTKKHYAAISEDIRRSVAGKVKLR